MKINNYNRTWFEGTWKTAQGCMVGGMHCVVMLRRSLVRNRNVLIFDPPKYWNWRYDRFTISNALFINIFYWSLYMLYMYYYFTCVYRVTAVAQLGIGPAKWTTLILIIANRSLLIKQYIRCTYIASNIDHLLTGQLILTFLI